MDDLFSWAPTFRQALHNLESQLLVCAPQNLSLSLKKSLFFPPRIEFVGHYVCENDNRPAQSKHNLLKTWPIFRTVRDVASFVGVIKFYSQYVPQAELHMLNLRALTKLEYETVLGDLYTPAHEAEQKFMLDALLADPCLMRYNCELRCYLRTDWSAIGMGFVLLQPADDTESRAAMRREIAGGPCKFMLLNAKCHLRPICFGSRKSRGRESKLHSHLGEGFCGDWVITKVSTAARKVIGIH